MEKVIKRKNYINKKSKRMKKLNCAWLTCTCFKIDTPTLYPSFGVWRQFIVGRLKQKKSKPLNRIINGFKLWCRRSVTGRLRFLDCNHRCGASEASMAQREGGAGDSPLRISFDFPRQGTDSTHGTQLLIPQTLTNLLLLPILIRLFVSVCAGGNRGGEIQCR